MKNFSIKAILVGGVLYLLLSNLLSLPLIIHTISATKVDNSDYVLINYIKAEPVLYGIQVLTEIASSVFAGYVAAWIAKERELIYGFLSSFISVCFAIQHIIAGHYTAFKIETIAYAFIPPVFGLLGGYIKYKQNLKLAVLK
jgi:putative membrane protein (TIGR04086 family)